MAAKYVWANLTTFFQYSVIWQALMKYSNYFTAIILTKITLNLIIYDDED